VSPQSMLVPSLKDQRALQMRLGIEPQLTVISTPERGRIVQYNERGSLNVGSLIALYRCLLVRKDRYESWMAKGTVSALVDVSFWRNYTIVLEFSDSDHEWLGLPVGDGGDAWWKLGSLSRSDTSRAQLALNQQILVDWQAHADPSLVSDRRLPSAKLQMMAHLFNEPEGDALPNVDVRAHGAYHCGAKRTTCGIMLATRVVRTIRTGDELVWCYGKYYTRHYEVSTACMAERTADYWDREL